MSEETLNGARQRGKYGRSGGGGGVIELLGREGNCAARMEGPKRLCLLSRKGLRRGRDGGKKGVLERKDFAGNRDKGHATGKEGRKEEAAIFLQTTAA